MVGLQEIVDAYSIRDVDGIYPGQVEITDLKRVLNTKGHLLVVRGDKAYEDKLGDRRKLANPKFWLYENIINSERVQSQLREHKSDKLFDGVGYSALEALGFHAKEIGRGSVAVMAHEMLPEPDVQTTYGTEIIHGEKPMEVGYIEKQAEVLSTRNDLIPLNQALYGANALALVGNNIVKQLKRMNIEPDTTLWCIASGSNLYGIGGKIKQRFPHCCETIVVEPEINKTIDSSIDFTSPSQVKTFAKKKLEEFSLDGWNGKYSGIFPLHISLANRYLLLFWANQGNFGFDNVISVSTRDTMKTLKTLVEINPEYNWSKTTFLTLTPAIELANQGKNVLVMAYGRNLEHKSRGVTIENTT